MSSRCRPRSWGYQVGIEDRTCFIGEIGLEGDQVAFQVNESIADAVKLIGKIMDSKKMDIVMDVKVSVTVQLGTAELPMKEVVELSPELRFNSSRTPRILSACL